MDIGDEKKPVVTILAYRSPVFSIEEITKLVDLVEKFKSVILNKSVNASANKLKELTWHKIAKLFNNSQFKYERNVENLKTKWENLKKEARKVAGNVLNVKDNEYSDIITRILSILNDVDINISNDMQIDSEDEDRNSTNRKSSDCDGSVLNDLEESMDENVNARDRSVNFTAKETKLLLQCVREEKDIVFLKDCSGSTNKLKNSAWTRIGKAYNTRSPVKRPVKVLRTKFINMKRLSKTNSFKEYIKDLGKKREKLVNDYSKDVKTETEFDKLDFDASRDEGYNDIHNAGDKQHGSIADPLSTVLSHRAGSTWSCRKSKEVVRLKVELLNYQLETAKLERQRVKDAMLAEASDREVRAIEAALRLRTARLQALSAEMKLPPSHPALTYTPAESRAQQYVHSIQYQT